VSASDASLALAAVFVSGLTAMVFEVAWTRVLSLNIGTSAYAFSMILSAFIAGLSLGSLLSARLVYRWRSILPVLAATQVLIGLTALMVSHALGGLPILLSNIPANLLRSTGRLFVAQFAVALLVMLVPTFLLGAMFPMVLHLYAGRVHKSAVSTGVVYAVNTAVGVRNTILAACLINVAIGAFYLGRLALSARRPRRLILAALPVAMAIAGTLLLPDWNKAILSSGPFLYAAKYQQFARREKVSCCLPGLVAQPRQVGFPLARQV
jgi:spermidine synthase